MQVKLLCTHLVLDGTQVGQDDTKAHGDNEDQNARNAFAQASQQHCIQRGHVWAIPCCVEVDEVKVPVACTQQLRPSCK